jgi:MFS family permease
MNADAVLPRRRFALLFAVMLVAASGNTAMQSLMPAIGRELKVPDLWVAVAFSLSAVAWVAMAPYWARRADRRGRRALMRLGLSGFIASMLVCGSVLALGLDGRIAAGAVFPIFIVGRGIYGLLGSASPSAVQAYVAARTEGERRTVALAGLASSFGLGTIVGPAIAPLFIFAPLGLAGPLFVFAAVAGLVLAALVLRLPDDTPRSTARGEVSDYPAMGAPAASMHGRGDGVTLRWRDRRVLPWLVSGIVGGHGNAALMGVIGFLIIDRTHVPLAEAQQQIAIVLMAGAGATLLAQWALIPYFQLDARQLVVWGSTFAGLGTLITGWATGAYGIALGFALSSLGFGFFRPGFTSGASLAVTFEEQNAVAGMVSSVNGVPYVAAPAVAVALYELARPLPFAAVAAAMIALAAWASWRLRR